MATIGTITIAFGADLSGLTEGIEKSLDLFGAMKDGIKELSDNLAQLSEKQVTIVASVDTSDIARARSDIDGLSQSSSNASTQVALSVDSAQIDQATESIDDMNTSIEQTAEPAAAGRSALASLVVTTARVSAGVSALSGAYTQIRESTLGYIQASTGAASASDSVRVIQAALRGNIQALEIVFNAAGQAIFNYVSGLFSVEGASRILQGAVGAAARAFGISDGAVVASIQHLSSYITNQIAAAGTHRLAQRSLAQLGQAYDRVANAATSFITSTSAGASAGRAAASAIDFVARTAVRLDGVYQGLIVRLSGLAQNFNIMGAVSAATGTAFDAIASTVTGLLSRTTTLSSVFSAAGRQITSLVAATARLLPSVSAVSAAMSTFARSASVVAGIGSRLASTFGTLLTGLSFVREAATQTGAGFAGLVTRMVATSAATGGVLGGVSALFAGTSVLTGAITGATGAIGGLLTAFPAIATFAVAAAVATGRFYDQLKSLAGAVESTEQLADRFGATTQEMERLKLAAEFSGVSLTMLSRSQQSFFSNLSKVKIGQLDSAPVREAKIAFDKLGVSMADLKAKEPRQIFAEVAEKLTAVKDPAERTAIAMDLLGQRGAMILPALKEFGELAADFDRLGGALSKIDFDRFSSLEQSFDRTEAASKSLGRALLIPFVEVQKAFNNFSADVSGGLSKAFAPLASMVADVTKPLAAIIEAFGRMISVLLRIIGLFTSLAAALQVFSSLAAIFDGFSQGFKDAMKPLEDLIAMFTSGSSEASAFKVIADLVASTLRSVGVAVGYVVGLMANLLIGIAAAAAGWAIYTVAVALASATSIFAAASFVMAWSAAILPITIAVAILAALGAAVMGVGMAIVQGGKWLYSFGQSIGIFGETQKEIDGATASVEELAAAAEENSKPKGQKAAEQVAEAAATGGTAQVDFGGEDTAQVNFDNARTAAVEFGMSMGLTAEQAAEAVANIEQTTESLRAEVARASAEYAASFKGPSREEITQGIQAARDEMGELVIESARFGDAGRDVAATATTEFNKLQTQLGKGSITLQEFRDQSAEVTDNLKENLDAMKNNAPEITLKKNIELYKQLDDAVKAAGKSVRDIAAGTVIDGKLFPASATVKANAEQYKNEYAAALDAIKKKLQSGGFADELKAKRETLQADFDSGKISRDEFVTKKLELDTTSAQEQASIAGEEAKREFDRKFKKLGEDVSFADNIRKELETAFLSPVQKFEKELKKVKDNPALTDMEKTMAEVNLRKQAREGIVGKGAQTQFQERSRDVRQAAEAGLINTDEMNAELKKASEEFASAVGVTKTPFETFSSSLDNIAKQFGFAGQPIDVVREKLKGNAEQLANFDRAVKESRDNLLASLGIEKSPQQVFEEQMKKIGEAENSTDPNKRITKEQADQARAVATRKRDSELGAGEDVAGQLRERQAKINEAYGGGKDPAKLAVAQNKLDMDRRSAAGLDATPAQALQAGVDKINDVFGAAGKGTKEYNEAIKKNRDTVLQSIGVEKSAVAARKEMEEKIGSLTLTAGEAAQAERKKNDAFMSALGITKTPFEQFSGALDSIAEQFDMAGRPISEVRAALQGNAKDLALFERAVKQARDAFLADLGIDKSPQQVFEEQMKKIEEAVNSTDPEKQITAAQADEARRNATRKRDESLGGESAADFGGRIAEQRGKIEEAYGKDGANDPEKFASAMRKLNESIPGAEQQSPVKKFQEDLEKLKASVGEGTPEFEQGKMNLQAQLQEDLKPALDSTKQDRRGIEASDARSKGGVDTFFRILRGNDNPSLKAQLEVARNTKILAEAAKNPQAAPAIAQLSPGR
jgi:hypothetical protein